MLPTNGEQGQYIAKFPPAAIPSVLENEFANLALAEAIGMDVPERELIEISDLEGVPRELRPKSEGKALLVKRFDRGTEGQKIHIEDFA